jgi:hypothetical protein
MNEENTSYIVANFLKIYCLCGCYFEIGFNYVAQTGLQLTILLPWPPTHDSLALASQVLGLQMRATRYVASFVLRHYIAQAGLKPAILLPQPLE